MNTFVLQLPNSYVDIDREEMEYLDGGAPGVWKVGWWIDFALESAGFIIGVYSGIKTVRELKRLGSVAVYGTQKLMKKAGYSLAATSVGYILDQLDRFFDFSIGVALAKAWDRVHSYPGDNERDTIW